MRSRSGGRWIGRAAIVSLALLAAPRARAEVRILAVEPSRTESTLTCHVRTSGLPDSRSLETLTSGLPSSLSLSFSLVDAAGRERGGSSAEIRLEPDPWERAFLVRGPNLERRVTSLEDLAALLGRLGPFPVAPLRRIDVQRSLRIRVRLAVHPLAPAEAEQARALFSGDMGGGGADRREVSAGLGTLLRFFLGRTPAGEWSAQATSPAVDPRTLPRTP